MKALERLRALFGPKKKRAGTCVNCLSKRTEQYLTPTWGQRYCRCEGCGHTWTVERGRGNSC